jgi:hypothetical protein
MGSTIPGVIFLQNVYNYYVEPDIDIRMVFLYWWEGGAKWKLMKDGFARFAS